MSINAYLNKAKKNPVGLLTTLMEKSGIEGLGQARHRTQNCKKK
jgi:hypothetical protein